MTWRRRALVAAFLVPLLSLAACSSNDDDAATSGPQAVAGCDGSVESPDTRFIVDECGRVVILRGVNVASSSKGGTQGDTHLPATAVEDQEVLATWGWNTVRFLVFWGAIEPEDGRFDEAYLDEVAVWVNWYEDHGIEVVLDMHQDLYGWKVNGNGAPDWAVDTKGLEVQALTEGQPWYLQGVDPAVQQAYQSFWNPSDGQRNLKVDYHEALAHLAERFADSPAVIGYDVMNEPSFANGDLEATVAMQDEAKAGTFENPNLTTFMQDGIEAVRSADDDAYVFIEPTSLLNAFPYAGDLLFEDLEDPRDGPPRLVYAGHLYEPKVHDGLGYSKDSTYVDEWESLRTDEAKEMDAALWFGEWGGAPAQDRMDEYVSNVLAMADDQMIGWTWWSWDPGGWSPVEEDGRTLSANGERLLRVQVRAVAGTPTYVDASSPGYSASGGPQVFQMGWDERVEAVGPTEVAVPAQLYEGTGIKVVVDGRQLSAAEVEQAWDRSTSVLLIEPDRSLPSHEMCIAAPDDSDCAPTAS